MATKRNLRSKHKRKTAKKHRVQRRTKKYLKKNMSKRRRRYSKRVYQKGGLFNDTESAQLKEELKRIGFTDNNEINNIIIGMGKMSQQHSKPQDFKELLHQMNSFHNGDTENFKEWLNNIEPMFEERVETDAEDSDNSDIEDNSDDEDI